MSMTPEERRARLLEQKRRWREANKEANKEKEAERQRRYREANKEKELERLQRWREVNKEKVVEKGRQYREDNKEKLAEQKRQYRETNKEKVVERKRRFYRRKGFARENGSSFEAWVISVRKPVLVFEVIANLTPDPGQTLAELIHELSGYAMEVCEQIADPPVAEETPELTPPADPDLF